MNTAILKNLDLFAVPNDIVLRSVVPRAPFKRVSEVVNVVLWRVHKQTIVHMEQRTALDDALGVIVQEQHGVQRMLHESNLGHAFNDFFALFPRGTDQAIDIADHLDELEIKVRALRDDGVFSGLPCTKGVRVGRDFLGGKQLLRRPKTKAMLLQLQHFPTPRFA